jgi:hypothetical protein
MPPKHFGMTQKGAAPSKNKVKVVVSTLSFRCEIARAVLLDVGVSSRLPCVLMMQHLTLDVNALWYMTTCDVNVHVICCVKIHVFCYIKVHVTRYLNVYVTSY